MAFVNERPQGKSELWRTVDYDRDIVLKAVQGLPYNEGIIFNLEYQGKLLRFGAKQSLRYAEDKKHRSAHWHVLFLKVPICFKNDSDHIKQVIMEALEKFGDFCRPDYLIDATADIDEVNPEFYEGELDA